MRHAVGQDRFPFRSPAVIRRAQERRIARQVEHAYRTVPYYREAMDRLGLRPEALRTAADLARLPLLTPKDLQRRADRLVSTDYPRETCLALSSSGTTGTPRTMWYDAASLVAMAAHDARQWGVQAAATGLRRGVREAVLSPPGNQFDRVRHAIIEQLLFPRRWLAERRHFSMLDPLPETIRSLNAFQPHVIHGYGSHLAELFRCSARVGAEGLTFRPRVVTYTSEALSRPVARFITETWGIPVLGTYRATEALTIGWPCGAGDWLHVNDDLYPVRIVDAEGREVPDGETGAVVISNLLSRATVLLNYRLGDRAARLPGPCPCGRTLPRLSLPDGRDYDWVVLPSGQRVHPQALCDLFCDDDVWGSQIEQNPSGRFRVAVVAREGSDREALRRRLRDAVRRQFGTQIALEIVFVASIAPSSSGKIRLFVRSAQRGP